MRPEQVAGSVFQASSLSTIDADAAGEPTPAEVGRFLADVATQIATGSGGDVDAIVAAPDLFFRVIAASGNGFPFGGGNVGSADFRSYQHNAFGVNWVRDNSLTASTGYAFSRDAIGVKESPGAPFSITADAPATLAQDVAVYGFGALYLRNADGVVKVSMDTTP